MVGTIMCDISIINVRFFLLEVPYPPVDTSPQKKKKTVDTVVILWLESNFSRLWGSIQT